MEEDAGKALHMGGATGRIHGASHSLIDYNRAGVPLIEIVTRPVRGAGEKAPEVAKAYVAHLRELLRSLGVSDVRMEQGSLRCDANISLMPIGSDVLGTRTETKNVNSLRSVERAIRYEMTRQAAILDGGGRVEAGDPPLPRGHRHHLAGALQGGGGGLPLLRRAGPDAHRPLARVGRGAARHAARAARRTPGAPAGAVGVQRRRLRQHRGRRCARARRGDGGGGRLAGRGPEVVGHRAGASGQRGRRRAGGAGHHARPGRGGAGARRRGQGQRQAGPPGDRGRARR